MHLELIGTLASVGTFLVIGATAIAAAIQLRHMRASNQLGALLDLEHEFRAPDLQDSFRFVEHDLADRLRDRAYRAELERIGFIDARAHQEINVLNWFDEMGAVLKNHLVDENAFMDLFSRLAVQHWETLAPAISILRRRRGRGQNINFEYLAIRARAWLSRHPEGVIPKGTVRVPMRDQWLAQDSGEVDSKVR
jgi:hypothetical protein